MRKPKKHIEDAIGVVFDQRDRIATLKRDLAEAQERLAMAVEALKPFAQAERAWMAGGPPQQIRMDWLTAAREAEDATAEAVAQHTASVERRGALKAARRILESFAELVEQHQFEVKDKEDLCYLVLHTGTIKMLLWEWARKVEDGAADLEGA